VIQHREYRLGQADDPRQHQQQADAHEHRQEQAEPAGELLLLARQFVDQDGDENDVVDTQDQFQRGQGEKGDPDFGGSRSSIMLLASIIPLRGQTGTQKLKSPLHQPVIATDQNAPPAVRFRPNRPNRLGAVPS
jgi:hypothetical protein